MNKNFYKMRGGFVTQGLVDLIDFISAEKDVSTLRMIEIGSYVGESTTIFANRIGQVLCIDPFENDYDPNDAACHHADFSDVYEAFRSNTKLFTNINLIRKRSDDAIDDLKGQMFDLVYIDGMHTYEQVKKDIENYKQFIKPDGYICGHDFSHNWPDVIKAVYESVGAPDKTFQDTSWLKKVSSLV
jgi:predicted O-methyltransferase YrrM